MGIINSLQDKIELTILKKDIEYKKIELLKNISLAFKEENKLQDVLVYEDKFYDFKIKIHKEWDSFHLIIGNEEVKCIKNYDNKTEVEIKNENFFKCMYNWNNVTIVLKKGENTELYKSKYFVVATSKVSKEFIKEMLEDIYNFDTELLEGIFDNNKITDKAKSKKVNLKVFIQFVEKIYNFFSRNYPIFRINCKSRIIKKVEVVNIYKAHRLDRTSFQWILKNPENLQKINQESGIRYANENYIPQKILSEEKKISFECYENEVILGFLNRIRKDITNIYSTIDSLNQGKLIKQKYKIEHGYVVVSNIVKILLEERYREFKIQLLTVKSNIDKLYKAYKSFFKCKEVDIRVQPKFTDTFRSIKHYKQSFKLIYEFLNYNQFDFKGYSYSSMLVSLDHMYEYYCLIKLIEVYKDLGYKIVSNESIYGKEAEKVFILINGKEEIRIFYQLQIVSGENSKVSLRRRSYGKYIPDYVVMYKNNDREVFSIYDAKFSLIENVKKYYLENLCYKYIIDIYQKNQTNSPVINLAAFSIKGTKDKMHWCIDKSNRDVIPKIDIITISSYNNKKDILQYFNNVNRLAQDICSTKYLG